MGWVVRENQNESSELKHYGVKGMRWGVRKDDKSTRKKTTTSKTSNDIATTTITTHGDDIYDDYKKQNSKLIDFERGSIVHTPDLIASNTLEDLPRITRRLNEDQEAWKVNKGAKTEARNSNCFECTIAYEMRKRGYDVQANEKNGGSAAEVLHAFDVKDSFTIKITGRGYDVTNKQFSKEFYDQLSSQCTAYGDGARGSLCMYWPLGGGHAISWYVEDGEFHLIDPQDTSRDVMEELENCTGKAEVYRLDNAEILSGATDFVEAEDSSNKNSLKKKVEKLIKNVEKDVSNFVSKGVDFITSFFKKFH